MSITFVKASDYTDVRLQKFLAVSKNLSVESEFWGIQRKGTVVGQGFVKPLIVKYLWQISKNFKLSKIFGLIFFIIKVFVMALLKKQKFFYCADFEAAFPIALAKIFNKNCNFVYDIYDEVYIRYNFNKQIKLVLSLIDKWIINSSDMVVVVDSSRAKLCKKISGIYPSILENKPLLSVVSAKQARFDTPKCFAITGYLASTRGIKSILKMVDEYQDIDFLIAGRFTDDNLKFCFKNRKNCNYIGVVHQDELLFRLQYVWAIFSLYDPTVPINALAASNKLYDAMALGLPVIVNYGTVAKDYVEKNQIGFVVPYMYEKDSWSLLATTDKRDFEQLGRRGRELFFKFPSFENQAKEVLENLTGNLL